MSPRRRPGTLRTTTTLSRALAWLPLLACVLAAVLGVAGPDANAEPPPEAGAPSASAASAYAGGDAALPSAAPAAVDSPVASVAASASAAPAAASASASVTSASPLPPPSGDEVPLAWLPPGANVTASPSPAIFPPQQLTIRFDHAKHVHALGLTCKSCHAAAYASERASDDLLPSPAHTCDACHDVDHADLSRVKTGGDATGRCDLCHTQMQDGHPARVVVPTPNLRFNHKKHLDRNIACAQCHGQVDKLGLATRDQMPRMAGCFRCHQMDGAARGDAKGTCDNCHLERPDGRMRTSFVSGTLEPPPWLHQAAHTADWIERHKTVAGEDSSFCGSCHTAQECTDCHDGRVRPRNIHPNDFLSMHAEAARLDNPRCTSCHQLQTFCADCHRRVGVARDVASGNRLAGRRFHPPPEIWTTGPRGPGHHAWEAERNLNACVSCHTERDCATCHATKGVSGGQGVNPHPTGFLSKCTVALRMNPRPCLVCHQMGDHDLAMCR